MSSLHMHTDIPLQDITAFVQSTMASDLQPSCTTKIWDHAMKDPISKENGLKQCSNILIVVTPMALLDPPTISTIESDGLTCCHSP